MFISFLCHRRARRFLDQALPSQDEDLSLKVKQRLQDKFTEELAYLSMRL